MDIIARMVGRVHVGKSNRAVIRFVIGRLRGGYLAWRKLPRETRRSLMRGAIRAHVNNRRLYASVMSGRF